MYDSACELVRKNESDYKAGNTQISAYVNFSMFETINRIEAYLFSKHISGATDALDREKPFFNICIAASNIWMRATDIDRKHIKLRATKSKDWLDSFVANIHLRDWMNEENFGTYLNEWGRVLARYGSAITKFVENSSGLHISVIPWNRIIVDPIDFDSNPRIEIIELTEAQLYDRIDTNGYDPDKVKALMSAITTRESLDRRPKDTKTGYIRLYEVHGKLSLDALNDAQGVTSSEGDDMRFTQQMQVVSFVGKKVGRNTEYEDFVLLAGREPKDPYRLDHLIKEDGRSLSIGSVEHLFESQWMMNHAAKTEKDTLDLASRLIFQTADGNFLNMNVLDNIESGDILIHTMNMPLSQVNTAKPDIVSMMNFGAAWKEIGNEINGISNAMLGIQGTRTGMSARYQQTLLQESYSLFELMTENKALAIESMMHERILDYIKTKMDTTQEVSAVLEAHDITRIDSVFFKNEAIKSTNKQVMQAINANLDRIAQKQPVQPIDAGALFSQNIQGMQDSAGLMGNTRFFKPSDLPDKTWNEQFKDLVWELDVDIAGENQDMQGMLTALNGALGLVMQPGFSQNKKAQAIVGRVLELTGAMSPIEYASIPDTPPAQPMLPNGAPSNQTPTSSTGGALQNNSELNIR